jgi:hypothetical protein
MNTLTKSQVREAKSLYGTEIVVTVIETVAAIDDPDGVWSMYQDMGMEEHAECLEFLYFDM